MLMVSYIASYSQNVGIGTTNPDNSAQLDIVSNSRGLLIPRMTTAERTSITNPAKGLMVFDTETNGFWFYNGSSWTNMNSVVNAWSLTGNAGTDPNVNFIGTTDDKPITFMINGSRVGRLDSDGNIFWGKGSGTSFTTGKNSIGIGTGALSKLSAQDGSDLVAIGDSSLFNNIFPTYNTAVGSHSLYSNISGRENAAFGFYSLHDNIDGNFNTAAGLYSLHGNTSGIANCAFGHFSLSKNTTGSFNTVVGENALSNNTTGSYNTTIGANTLNTITTGTYNTAIGYGANVNSAVLYNATAIGAFARADFNNTLVLGSVQGVNGAAQDVSVGIGTTSPYNALSIHTDSRADGWVQLELTEKGDDFARIRFDNTIAGPYWHIAGYPNNTAASARMNFYLSSVGDILSLRGDGNAWLKGTLTQNSDLTLKTNVIPLTGLISSVMALSGYRYNWKDKNLDQSTQIGLLAQEVQKYFPELVKKDDHGALGVNYTGFIPIVIETIKEQQHSIETLEEKNIGLEAELQKLKALVNKLVMPKQ